MIITRRRALIGAMGVSGLALAGCDQLNESEGFKRVLSAGEAFSRTSQRLILGKKAPLAREFKASDISAHFKANGSIDPQNEDYLRHAETGFADWRLKIGGLRLTKARNQTNWVRSAKLSSPQSLIEKYKDT